MPARFIVIPVHNRREVTLGCLRHLRSIGAMPEWSAIVVDGGSTDGTAEAVRAEFPATEVLQGSSDLWWTGAIALGMRRAMALQADQIVWLNDDCLPEAGSLAALLEESRPHHAITGGVCSIPGDPTPAYSGMRKTLGGMVRVENPGSGTLSCDALHGNLVSIPASVVERLGYPDERGLPHALGDLDYTLRARHAGIPVLLVGRARATTQANLSLNYRSWLLSDVSLRAWWRELGRTGSHMNWRSLWRFHCRHWGVVGAAQCISLLLRLAAISVVRLIVPVHLLRRLRGGKSAAWQHEARHRVQKP
ncbi:MAG: glycosyltransferase family 2 protein [Verrucomicrobia bacterium]|nr:glycosyltransferase family 2 protein [Verrucomicrobiota bacterium]